MSSCLPDLHMQVAARKVMEKMAARCEPRAVFLMNGKLLDYPADGVKARNFLNRDGQGVIALGVYDHDVTLKQILEDVSTLQWA